MLHFVLDFCSISLSLYLSCRVFSLKKNSQRFCFSEQTVDGDLRIFDVDHNLVGAFHVWELRLYEYWDVISRVFSRTS
ncbi:hypothetical protein P8452_25212 [Trifolium repens]|nr:hypothetical protein P8452_25212 [Trifolium repens]